MDLLFFGLFGNHKHSEDGTHCRYRGIQNKVRFVEREGRLHIYIQGPYATEIGFEIEDLQFMEFVPSKKKVVTYSEQSREDLVERILAS